MLIVTCQGNRRTWYSFDIFGGDKKQKWHFKLVALLGNISKYQHEIEAIGLFRIEIIRINGHSICNGLMNLIKSVVNISTLSELSLCYYFIPHFGNKIGQNLVSACSYLIGVYTLHIIFCGYFFLLWERCYQISICHVFSSGWGCSSYIWFSVQQGSKCSCTVYHHLFLFLSFFGHTYVFF